MFQDSLLCLEHCFLLPMDQYYQMNLVTGGGENGILPPPEWNSFRAVVKRIVEAHFKIQGLLHSAIEDNDGEGLEGDISLALSEVVVTLQQLYPSYLNRQTAVLQAVRKACDEQARFP